MKSIGKVKVGTFSCQEEVITTLKNSKSVWNDDVVVSMIERIGFHVCKKEAEVELILVHAGTDLGITERTYYCDVLKKAESLGLHECHTEIAPLIPLNHPEVAKEVPYLTFVATEPLAGINFRRDKHLCLFLVSEGRLDHQLVRAAISPTDSIIFAKVHMCSYWR